MWIKLMKDPRYLAELTCDLIRRPPVRLRVRLTTDPRPPYVCLDTNQQYFQYMHTSLSLMWDNLLYELDQWHWHQNDHRFWFEFVPSSPCNICTFQCRFTKHITTHYTLYTMFTKQTSLIHHVLLTILFFFHHIIWVHDKGPSGLNVILLDERPNRLTDGRWD